MTKEDVKKFWASQVKAHKCTHKVANIATGRETAILEAAEQERLQALLLTTRAERTWMDVSALNAPPQIPDEDTLEDAAAMFGVEIPEDIPVSKEVNVRNCIEAKARYDWAATMWAEKCRRQTAPKKEEQEEKEGGE